MVVCRYFLQGTCRFGNNCRFEHSYRDYGNDGPASNRYRGNYEGQYFNSSNKYSYTNQNASADGYNIREIMNMVINELTLGEKGGQWPLSCFAPIKEKPCYPGLDDYSPEEIRWLMYQAVKSGTVEAYKQEIQQLLNSYKAKKERLLHPTSEEYATIERLFRGESVEDRFSQNTNAVVPKEFSFNLAAHTSDQHALQTNMFGAPHPNTSVFTNKVSNVNTPNLFGGAHAQQSSGFNINASVPSENIFGTTNHSSSNIHGAFGAKVDCVPETETKSQQLSFNSSPYHTHFGNQADNAETEQLYTRLEDLSEVDLNAFKAQTFTMGHVPTKPPPKEYVNA